MLDEARKREKIANLALLASLGLTAVQSQKDFLRTGHIESPGANLMQRYGQKRREAERNLDHGAVSQAARNIKDSGSRNRTVKQSKKSLKEFTQEVLTNEDFVMEMRKEDKVKGEKETPLYKSIYKKTINKNNPEGKWKVQKHEKKALNTQAMLGRMKQGMVDPTNPYSRSTERILGTHRHLHGGGGSGAREVGLGRGVKKVPGEKKERAWNAPPTPAQKVDGRRRRAKQATSGYTRKGFSFEGFSNWRDEYSPLEVESFDLLINKPLEPTEGIGSDMLDEACWKGYEKKGMKKMFGKMYPNCVKKTRKEEVEIDEGKYSAPGERYVKGSAPVVATYGGKTEKFYKETYKKKGKKKEDMDKKVKAMFARQAEWERGKKKALHASYEPEGGEVSLGEAKGAKSCPSGKYWCYDSDKCKSIPKGYYVGRNGYLARDDDDDDNNGGGYDGGGYDGGGDGGGGGGE